MNTVWWSDAVTYQVYLRSFADNNGDGVGDLAGLTARLDHLGHLGVDAIWLNPCYVSPQKDHGYDIADYFAIDPAYGSVDDLERLVAAAHDRGMRLLMDMVANHCSDQHAWFQAALAATPGSPERARFLFRDGRGPTGDEPPNNWQSVFGGAAWTRVADGQWYFHAFDSSQPDFNWRNREVVEYFDDVMRFWFERGVDGFRIDVAHGLFKHEELPDWNDDGHNYAMWDQPEVHEIYRRWRAIGDSYGPEPKYFVGEIWVPSVESMSAYLQVDELHQAFSFDLLVQPWEASRMRDAIDRALHQGEVVGGPPAWTLSNHDVHRTATRYGQKQDLSAPLPTDMIAAARRRGDANIELGIQRARAAIMLQLALPGATYLYQGEELGLPEVFDLPDGSRQDPIWIRSGGSELGRDGCRVPMPWSAAAANFGFTPADAREPWLPQPSWFGRFAADLQLGDPESTLELYARLIATRRQLFSGDSVEWLETGHSQVVALRRGSGICVVNFDDSDHLLPAWGAVALTSSGHPDVGGGDAIPANSAAWFTAALETTATPGHNHMRSNDAPHYS